MMVEQPNLKVLEKSFYSKFQEDGIWDLMIGLFFLSFGLLMEFSDTTYVGFFGGLGGSLIYVMKRKITRPRLGYVKFSINNLKKHRSSYFSLAMIFIAIIILGIMIYLKNYPISYSNQFFVFENKILAVLFLALILAAVAFMFNIKRFLWYAVLIMLLFSLGNVMQLNKSYIFILLGTIIIVNGIKLLLSFIKKYPKLDATMESNGV